MDTIALTPPLLKPQHTHSSHFTLSAETLSPEPQTPTPECAQHCHHLVTHTIHCSIFHVDSQGGGWLGWASQSGCQGHLTPPDKLWPGLVLDCATGSKKPSGLDGGANLPTLRLSGEKQSCIYFFACQRPGEGGLVQAASLFLEILYWHLIADYC